MRTVLSLILGGGRGTRLYPLTKNRAKPAVPVAGKYRLIDIPISNCINSKLNRIYVLTQFLSVSLHRHIANTYKFDMFSKGFVEILAAQQAYDERIGWYQGTADAVRQNMAYIQREECEEVLILSGDQLYRMDYQDLVRTHRESKADVTIAAIPVNEAATSGFGLMKIDDAGRVTGFVEKPQTAAERKPYYTDAAWIDKQGIPSQGRNYLANMGIYLFNTDVLIELLNTPTPSGLLPHDFGKEVFPLNYERKHVHAHLFDGFWEDLGTITSYHECSLALAEPKPPFDFYTAQGTIYTRMRNLPASRIDGATLDRCTVADGCVVGAGSSIERGLLGVRSRIGTNCRLKEVLMIGSDYFETPQDLAENRKLKRPDFNIGHGTKITRAILDKDCRIGDGVTITSAEGKPDYDDPDERFYIRDGIVCVPRGAVIADGTTI